MSQNPLFDKCRNAAMLMAISHPHFLIIHSKLRYQEVGAGDSLKTMGITNRGTVFLSPEFVKDLDKEQLGGVLAHEMLHLVMLHHGRMGSRDPQLWNIAADMCINKALIADGIKLPPKHLMPPTEYTGDLFVEAVYEWLEQNPDKMQPQSGKGEGDGQPQPTQGCGVITEDGPPNADGTGEDGQSDVPDWAQVALEARSQAQMAGQGSSAVAHLLAPRQPKINWKKILRHGVSLACARPTRDYQTFARRHRRNPAVGPQFPGWTGFEPNVAVVIDVSGSMDRKWIDLIVAECQNLLKTFSGMNMYLVTHTSQVEWEGWVNQQTKAKLRDAVQFSGGTDPQPAYDAVLRAGRFDALIHFTDCYFLGPTWPEVPARHLVVGAFAREIYTKPPAGAHVIPCEFE